MLIMALFIKSNEQFKANTAVVLLDEKSFEEKVLNSKDIWLILFYSPSNEDSKAFIPIYEKVSKFSRGLFKIGAVDSSVNTDLNNKYGIKTFPTIKFFGENKEKPIVYESEKKVDEIFAFIFEKTKEIAKARLTELNKNRKPLPEEKPNPEEKPKPEGQKKPEEKEEVVESDKNVVVLTDANFDKSVLGSKDLWMVAFYAPWCGHCKRLLPQWNAAANRLVGKVKIAKIDATVNKIISRRYGIQGFPTIKIFTPGSTIDTKPEEYEGSRKRDDLVKFALDKKEGKVTEEKQKDL